MASPQAQALANYIQQQMQAGYTEEQLRQYLLQYGYQQQLIDEAFEVIHPKAGLGALSNLKLNVSPRLLLVGGGVILAVVLVIALFFVFFSAGPSIELSAQSLSVSPMAGESAQIRVSVGQDELRDDATVVLRLISSAGTIAASESFTMRSAQTSQTFSFALPDSIPGGRYTVRVQLSSGGDQFDAVVPIDVGAAQQEETDSEFEGQEPDDSEPVDSDDGGQTQREGTCFDGVQNGLEGGVDCGGDCPACAQCPTTCDDNNACTDEICSFDTGYECVYSPVVPCCGNGQCEFSRGETEATCFEDCQGFVPPEPDRELTPNEVIQKVKTEDLDENEAGELCSALPEEGFIDDCFSGLAGKTDNPIFCLYTSTNSSRDSCYMLNFVVNGKEIPDLCDEIYNSYLRQNCEALSKLKESDVDIGALQEGLERQAAQMQTESEAPPPATTQQINQTSTSTNQTQSNSA